MDIFFPFQNPSHASTPGIEGSSRIPQCNVVRTAKPSKIAKASGIIGSKAGSTLPKSLSNEKICQASSLVQKTTKNLFQSRFGKPPEPKPRAKMNTQQNLPVVQNSTFAVDPNRPSFTRSETYVRDEDSLETSNKIKSNVSQNVDIGNNLTQNVISKLQEQTFTTSNPVRMSISPVGPSYPFHAPRKMSDEIGKSLTSQVSSTPFRNTPIDKFSTQYLCDQKLMPPAISLDITGIDLDSTNNLQTNQKNQLNSTNVTENVSTVLNFTSDIAETTKPDFLDMCTPVASRVASREKFHLLAEDMIEDTLLVDTTLNLYTSSAQNQDTIISRSSVIDDSGSDNSTMKRTTMLLCLGDESRHENTLVPLMPVDGDGMEIDDRGNLASCGKLTFCKRPHFFRYKKI